MVKYMILYFKSNLIKNVKYLLQIMYLVIFFFLTS